MKAIIIIIIILFLLKSKHYLESTLGEQLLYLGYLFDILNGLKFKGKLSYYYKLSLGRRIFFFSLFVTNPDYICFYFGVPNPLIFGLFIETELKIWIFIAFFYFN